MDSSYLKKYADIFSLLGSPERLSILLVLHGSLMVKHGHGDLQPEDGRTEGCLGFSEIAISTEIDSSTRLSHHLSRLIDGELIEKIPFKDDRGRVFALYGVTEKWKEFARVMGIGSAMKEFLKGRYPEAYRDQSNR